MRHGSRVPRRRRESSEGAAFFFYGRRGFGHDRHISNSSESSGVERRRGGGVPVLGPANSTRRSTGDVRQELQGPQVREDDPGVSLLDTSRYGTPIAPPAHQTTGGAIGFSASLWRPGVFSARTVGRDSHRPD